MILLLVLLVDGGIYLAWRRAKRQHPQTIQPPATPAATTPAIPVPPVVPVAPAPPVTPVTPTAPVPRGDEVVRLQVTLDRLGFSPGVIDGLWGSQTRSALAAWQLSQQLPGTGEWSGPVTNEVLDATEVYTTYQVTADDLAALGVCPTDWLQRSLLDRLPHETLIESLAERFHCRESFLKRLNQQVLDWSQVVTGQLLQVPAVEVATARTVPKAAFVRIRLGEKFIRAFDLEGRVMAHYPCSIGARREKRPVGQLQVVNIALMPNYTYDPAVFPELDAIQRGYGKLVVPPGPNNPVGTAWIGLNKPGYGIHGTPRPESIGKTESHGCFRLANWNAERLVRLVEVGTPVEVVE